MSTIKIGDKVKTVGDFEELRKIYGFPYPKKDDILTVKEVTKHPVQAVGEMGIVMLYFEELPDLLGVCDKQVDDTPNFIKVE